MFRRQLPDNCVPGSWPMLRCATRGYSSYRVSVGTRSQRRKKMLLEDTNAVIYGGGGSIGGAVGRAFAREGARVFLAGRTLTRLEEVAEEIRSTGGIAETARVDALDEKALDEHADAVAAGAGGIDISFNLIDRKSTR